MDCLKCKGRGGVEYKPPGAIMPGTLACTCVRDRDIRYNLERGWKGLTAPEVVPVEESPLAEYHDRTLWVTAPLMVFRSHLHRIAYDRGARWKFNLFSDADMMNAWLSRMETNELLDTDVYLDRVVRAAPSGRFAALVDLVEPPSLLIVRTGVKVARNSAMPEVFLEALRHREQISKPTWVVDSPVFPLGEGQVAYSEQVMEFLSDWPRMVLSAEGEEEEGVDQEEEEGVDQRPKTIVLGNAVGS